MKKHDFCGLLVKWFIINLVVLFINGATLKSWLLNSIVKASLGIYLLFRPTYPEKLEWHYGKKKATLIIRIIAIVEIVLSFFIRIVF